MADPLRLVVGALVVWAPGLAWTWALAPRLDAYKFLAVSVIVALTLQPALLFGLNMVFGVPLTVPLAVAASMVLTVAALAWAQRSRLSRFLYFARNGEKGPSAGDITNEPDE